MHRPPPHGARGTSGRPASDRTSVMEESPVPRPFLPWLGRACRQAREERKIVQVKIAAAIEVNQATIARFEDGVAWPKRPEELLMAYASELNIDVRMLWIHAFVLWLENEPVLHQESQDAIRAALKRVVPQEDAAQPEAQR
jgi:DNA-binding XRE family transcriptional regulator